MKFLKILRGFFLPTLILIQIPKLFDISFISVDFLLILSVVITFALYGFIGGMEFCKEVLKENKK